MESSLLNLSKAKAVYALTTNNFFNLQNPGIAYCIRYQEPFEENNIIATYATNRRYCYRCAAKINLVSGNITKDLQLDISFKDTNNHTKNSSRKIHLDKSIEILATEIIKESFARSLIPSKNLLGLACASIYYAIVLSEKYKIEEIIEKHPVNFQIIKRNFCTLRYFLTNSKLLERFDGNFM